MFLVWRNGDFDIYESMSTVMSIENIYKYIYIVKTKTRHNFICIKVLTTHIHMCICIYICWSRLFRDRIRIQVRIGCRSDK